MKILNTLFALSAASAVLLSASAPAAVTPEATKSKGKILIVLSSETTLPLKGGKTFLTGYYLNELTVPAKKFSEAGYELVFADVKGNTPAVDGASLSADYFGGSKDALDGAMVYKDSLVGLAHPLTLDQVVKGGLGQYKAVFVPGGPAPMIDLMADPTLGEILRYFHQHQKTTILLCHGPIALLSATGDPVAVQEALRTNDTAKAKSYASSWPYKGYNMTTFSNEEEGQAAKNVFHAESLIYPQRALETAGGKVLTGPAWHPNVIRDRELITGQNPFSDAALMDLVLSVMASNN